MSTQTTNYKLVKPEAQDVVDIGVINGNMDVIDAQLKELDNAPANAKTALADADTVQINDSADSSKRKKITWANIKTALSSVFAAKTHTHTKSQISDFPTSIAPAAHAATHKAGGSDALSVTDIGGVPATRTINNKALSSNITLGASDVGAVPINGDSTINGYLTAKGLEVKDAPFSGNINFEPSMSRLEISMYNSQTNGLAMLMLSPDVIKFMDNDGYEHRIIHEGNMSQYMGVAAASLV